MAILPLPGVSEHVVSLGSVSGRLGHLLCEAHLRLETVPKAEFSQFRCWDLLTRVALTDVRRKADMQGRCLYGSSSDYFAV